MKRGGHLVGCCLAIGLLVGCGKSREAAQAATEKFHLRVIRGAYAEIYAQAAPELRTATSEDQFEKLMNVVERRLGRFESAAEAGWRVNVGTGGKTVFLGYKSHFEKGNATEQFVWRPDEPEPKLVGYHIDSPLLTPD